MTSFIMSRILSCDLYVDNICNANHVPYGYEQLRSVKYGGNFIAAQAKCTGFCRCQRGGQVLKSDWSLQVIRPPYGHLVAQGIRDAPALTISPVADAVSETAAQPASDPKITRRPAVRIMKPMIWIL